MAFESSVSQIVDGPDTLIRLQWRDTQGGGIPTFAARNFGIQEATLCEFTSDWRVNNAAGRSRAEWGIFRTEVGGGIVVAIDRNGATWTLSIGTSLGWSQYGSFIDSTSTLPGLAVNTFFRMHIKAEVKEDDTTTVTATVRDLSDNDIGSITATVNVPRGNFCGFHSTFDQLGAASTADFKDIRVQASGSTGIVANLTAVNYLYTFVNNLGEESAPSFPTEDVLRPDGVSVTVGTSTTAPTGYDAVTHKRIYRLVSGNTGDLYRLVTELPIATAEFLDTLTDNQLSLTILESQDFDLPPATLEGIIALPNGIYAGFFENNLCLSAKGWAHAWPIRQRLPVDSDIVAIANIDNTIVIGTKTYVYTASGSDAAAYTMSKPGAPQSCSSKLGMTFLDGQGVVFPSPDGWCVCAGSAGAVTVATEGVFTKEQWQALNPTSIVAAVHDGILHWWYDSGEVLAETVLFLFHMTNSEGAEGLSELAGGEAGYRDQTGATWSVDSTGDIVLEAASPAPQFGAFSLGTLGPLTIQRDSPQFNGSPDTYSTEGATALQIDLWVYRADTNGTVEVEVGVDSYPFNSVFNLRTDTDGLITFGFESTDEESFATGASFAVELNEWTHLRMLCVGNAVRLYVNGVADELVAETVVAEPIQAAGPISRMLVSFSDTGTYADDVRATINGSTSTDNFTPPAAPWPNP